MSNVTPIDSLYGDAVTIVKTLEPTGELSLQVTASDQLRKVLLIAAASYFEHRVCEAVLEFVRERSRGSELVAHFVRNKAISRQYHTWFQWPENNANFFFALFGDEFKAMMVKNVKTSDQLRESIKAFLELGNERNRIVHENYVTVPLEKTLEEIYGLYQNARSFVDNLPAYLRACDTEFGL